MAANARADVQQACRMGRIALISAVMLLVLVVVAVGVYVVAFVIVSSVIGSGKSTHKLPRIKPAEN